MIDTSLNDVIATIFTLRTLVKSWVLLPIIIVVCPILVDVAFKILNLTSNGHSFLLIIGTILLTFVFRSFIISHSPSIEHREDALRKSFPFTLPMISFTVSHLLLWFFPISLVAGNLFKVQIQIPHLLFLKIAVMTIILGLIVILRYTGPVSLVRCSAFPLVSRPLTTNLKFWFAQFTSKEAILELILTPSKRSRKVIDHTLSSTINNTEFRRYQGPSLQKSFLLLVLSTCLALVAAFVFSYNQPPENKQQLSFCLPVIIHVLMTCLDGKAHELNPIRYQKNIWKLSVEKTPQLRAYFMSTLVSIVVVSIFAGFYPSVSIYQRFKVASFSLLISALSTLYMSFVDLICHVFLFKEEFNLQRLIGEMVSDMSPNLSMEVVIKTLLMGDAQLIKSILMPGSKHRAVALEDEELFRNEENAKKIAAVFMAKTDDFGLAEDLFRVLTLESLGGSDIFSSNLEASERHMQTVKLYVESNPSIAIPGQPWCIPLVRALCAYVAGFGLKLEEISKIPKSKKDTTTHPIFETWTIPPGAICCSQWAMTAATRCVVKSITSDSYASFDWRASCLSVFVPTLLVTVFQLRSGIQSYEKKILPERNSDLLDVKNTCDDCALFLLKKLKSLEGSRSVEVTIPNADCRKWIERLTSCIGEASPGMKSPLHILEKDKPLTIYNPRGFTIKYY